jgi:hypothetical protein
MGLDMYAYKVRADLACEDGGVIKRKVLEHLGFEWATKQDLEHMSEAEREVYFRRMDEVEAQAKMQDLFDMNFAYWRKFNALHGWMEQEWIERGGEKDFNCVAMRLGPADLDNLEAACESKSLVPTGGFFWGRTDDLTDEDYDEVYAFIMKARKAIEDGYAVYYDSWW